MSADTERSRDDVKEQHVTFLRALSFYVQRVPWPFWCGVCEDQLNMALPVSQRLKVFGKKT
jgi:hypothetical protein